MAVMHITKSNFETEVMQSDKPVLVDFWAAWCGPCQMLLPVMDEVAEEAGDVKVCKVNVDEEPELAAQYKVITIPTLVLIKNGTVLKTTVGVRPKTEILKMLEV
ncbi:MAG: thioredoxin [Lachnospiraceae bacterium]|nr:thioredoxin [Lachnospiraceae bacterium]